MINWPSMLLIGGAGRNSGKTRFCVSLLERLCAEHPLVGLKVTTIQDREGPCPRGNDDCGVCTSLVSDFEISCETGASPGKDTSQMVAAGAKQVFWLRVMRDRIARGAAALRDQIGPDTLCVCESNSLRHVVAPGVFLIVQHQRSDTIKPSARAVLPLSDRLVRFDGQGFDLPAGALTINGSRWVLGA